MSQKNLAENGISHQEEARPLVMNGTSTLNYEIVEPGHKKTNGHHLFLSSHSPFASKTSAHGFSSLHSVSSRVSHRLATAKPGLQSSWINVATPVPVGASHPANLDTEQFFKSKEEIEKEITAPSDRYNLVYLILLIHGIGTLMPWNMFLNANTYFTEFKLGPLNANETETEYAKNFLSYLGITAQLPNLILNGVNIICQCGGSGKNTKIRVVGSLAITIFMFIATVVLAMVDSNSWQGSFFGLTMATVVIINMCTGMYQNTIYGIAGQFPMKYTNAVVFGCNISGVLTAVIMIITLLGSPDIQMAAIWYFITAVIILCIAVITYFVLPLLRFYRHFINEKPVAEETAVEYSSQDKVSEKVPYAKILKKIWPMLFGVWLIFAVSLVCFPAIQADIEPSDESFFISKKLYTPVTCFLFFNLFAALGNLTTEWIRKPGPKYVLIPIVLRVLYIPFFMFCNFRPELRSLPVYINNDYAYIAGGITMAFTSGYYSSLCMMYAPTLVEPKYAGTAGMISAAFIILGIMTGVNFTLVAAKIVEL